MKFQPSESASFETSEQKYIENYIRQNMSKSARRIKGLRQLVSEGYEVTLLSFSVQTLLVDGKHYGWEILESPLLVKAWKDVK